uniref:Uncharacterized protein n=1 Tax=Candidatus Kentrum sp. SD TaxID=2126332 RepID=A0A450Z506_9GAMM|nr:MAG: hypothetical protein BECKSD772F_GA0070984_11015 [Candidatus Kentron sp. SD]VFK48842.1 MAG: hypothetical protein BECKSD772E_GA0070983_11445 [Candidatus Kentron sp. SD]VFK80474.1 MAG: hypothetical protein BECKSD772D_GA0070982_11186 [Candidatus Kentron sp. SD]
MAAPFKTKLTMPAAHTAPKLLLGSERICLPTQARGKKRSILSGYARLNPTYPTQPDLPGYGYWEGPRLLNPNLLGLDGPARVGPSGKGVVAIMLKTRNKIHPDLDLMVPRRDAGGVAEYRRRVDIIVA